MRSRVNAGPQGGRDLLGPQADAQDRHVAAHAVPDQLALSFQPGIAIIRAHWSAQNNQHVGFIHLRQDAEVAWVVDVNRVSAFICPFLDGARPFI